MISQNRRSRSRRATNRSLIFETLGQRCVLAGVIISEVLAANSDGLSDSDSDSSDWIELYNSSTSAVDYWDGS
jgi:hypothetical protein